MLTTWLYLASFTGLIRSCSCCRRLCCRCRGILLDLCDIFLSMVTVHVTQIPPRFYDVSHSTLELLGLRKAEISLAVPEDLCSDVGVVAAGGGGGGVAMIYGDDKGAAGGGLESDFTERCGKG